MARTYTQLFYHVVFSTKGRAELLPDALHAKLFPYMGGIVRKHGGTALEIGGTRDHVHALLLLPARVSVPDAVQELKGASSRWVRKDLGDPLFGWQEGYAAFTVGHREVAAVRGYIRGQIEHHRITTFQEELVGMLQENGLEFDESELWD